MGKITKIIAAFTLVFATSGFMALSHTEQASASYYPEGCSRAGSVKVTSPLRPEWVSYESYYQQLRSGSKGECVRSLQRAINYFCGPDTDLVVDGVYGAKTTRAVRAIQTILGGNYSRVNDARVTVDGIAGKQTWGILQAFDYWPAGTLYCQ